MPAQPIQRREEGAGRDAHAVLWGGLGDGGMVAAGEPFLIEAEEVFGGFGWRAVHFR